MKTSSKLCHRLPVGVKIDNRKQYVDTADRKTGFVGLNKQILCVKKPFRREKSYFKCGAFHLMTGLIIEVAPPSKPQR